MSTTRYLQASFRGAPFLVESNSDEGGPRNIIHEFPGRKNAYAEASGVYAKRFSIEAQLIGDDFEKQLATLVAALDQEGPGKLVHPHRGERLVAIEGPYREMRDTCALGMVRLSITFVEVGEQQEPRVTPDTGSLTKERAAFAYLVIGGTKPDFDGPDFLTAAARSILAGPMGFITTLSKVNNRINSAFGLIDDVSATIDDFSGELTTLLNTPDTLGLRIMGLVNSVLAAVTAATPGVANRGDAQRNRSRVSAVVSYANALGKFGDGLSTVSTATPSREQEAENQAVLIDLVETAGLINAAEVLVDLPFDNADQAGSVFEMMRLLFDRIADRNTLDDASMQALADVRAAFYQHLVATTGDLPGLGRYTPPRTVPALVLAYRLYGDSSRVDEIIERNPSIEHPGFVQGGVELSIAEL